MSWKKVKLGSFLKARNDKFKPNDKFIKGLKRIEKIDFSGKIYLSEKVSKTNMILIKKGDLVISGINVEKGAMSIYEDDEDVVATVHYSSYKFDKSKIDIDFLKLFLTSSEFKKAIKEQVPGGIKTEIKPKHLLPLIVEIPSDIQEQRNIVIDLNSKFVKFENLSIEQSHQLNLIQKLRQQILKDAMQGKLVAQNEDDEPASELLKKIKAEKGRLVKEKKIKKEKPLPLIAKEEIPFEIPKNWEWCRLGEVIELISGQDLKPNQYSNLDEGIPYITGASNLQEGRVLLNRWTTTPKSIAYSGDLLLTCKGSGIGKMAVLLEKSVHIARQIMAVRSRFLQIHFIEILLENNTEMYRARAKSLIPGIDRDTVLNTLLPLPPLAEQQRIVSKIDELMQLCDGLEESIKQNQKYTSLLYQTALKEALQPKPLTIKTEAKPKGKCKIIPFTPRYCDAPRRTILAGYIINQCNSNDFGRVQFQKLLYLVEHICIFDFNSNYVKKPAGPHDEALIKEVEGKLQQYQYYKIDQEKTGNKRVHYKALGSATELDSLFTTNFAEEKDSIDQFIAKFKKSKSDQCEIIATLYAVWNNRIIENKLINTELLKADFLEWDEGKARYKNRLDVALEWMTKKDIIPNGYGKIIERPMSM